MTFKKFKKGFFSKSITVLILILNIWFVRKSFDICMSGNSLPDSLIYSWFGFTTSELAILFGIKKQKIKKEDSYENRLEEETYKP